MRSNQHNSLMELAEITSATPKNTPGVSVFGEKNVELWKSESTCDVFQIVLFPQHSPNASLFTPLAGRSLVLMLENVQILRTK